MTALRTRTPCPVPGCKGRVDPGKLMCPVDWKAVPPHLQQAVYAAFRRWRSAGTDETFDALRAAQQAAIEAV
jgi:hypothetical protein